jgi:hypothetical protein
LSQAEEPAWGREITRIEVLVLLLFSVLYAVPVIMCWNQGYLDFGDGNYMYISWRLSQGAVLYRDILAPQPPLHLYIGAALAWLGDRLLPHPLWAFRTFSLLLHIATMVLIWATARVLHRPRLPHRHWKAVPLAAAAIYLVQPVGFWWTLGYQSQPLLIFLLLAMFGCVIKNTPRLATLGGLAGGLALLTNMTTAPYVAFTIGWMLLRRFRLGLLFTAAAILPPLLVIPAMEAYTGAYISNVFQNQAGAFPRAEVLAQSSDTIWGYVSRKLITEGGDVLRLEGTWIALAAMGMLLYGARRRRARAAADHTAEYALYYAFFSLCCIIYVAKGGTVDYVFSVAEPYVALFAAPVAVGAFLLAGRAWGPGPRPRDLTPIAAVLVFGALTASVAWTGLRFIYQTLRQDTYELAEPETLRIVGMIKQRTSPDDLIIAPPHFAFLARRRIADDYSEHFLWRIKYMNERLDGENGRAVKTVTDIADQLNQEKLPFLVMDMNQTGALPEIAQALKTHYKPLLSEPLQMLNTPLQFYVPLQ